MTTKPEGPAQEPLNVGGETKCKNCEQPKSAHLASGHIYCPISLGRACWYEPVDAATPAPSQPAAREWDADPTPQELTPPASPTVTLFDKLREAWATRSINFEHNCVTLDFGAAEEIEALLRAAERQK